MPPDIKVPVDWVAQRRAGKAMEPQLVGPDGALPVKSVEAHRIDGPDSGVDLRVYRPDGVSAMTIIHVHGGGWTLGDLDAVDHTARKICRRFNAVVVSCTYRLAPEHPFPAAYDDTLAAVRWTLAHVGELGGDAERVLILGDSAGGNLVAAVSLALRDEARRSPGTLPALRAQLLLYPVVDMRDSVRATPSYAADRDPSFRSMMLDLCVEAYVQGDSHGDWRASPQAADDLSGLPPTMVVVLGVDPLRDQAVDYAGRIKQAQVRCELIEFTHLTHGFAHIGALVPAAATALDEVLTRFEQFADVKAGENR
ncbi:MAG: alpha/beta hydrolase [Pseudomonadota bacterium]